MYHFTLGVNGAIVLLYRQWFVLKTLLGPETDHLWPPARALMFLQIFLETALHALLLMSLLLERRWRFFTTLWLYLCYRLTILHTMLAVVAVLLGTGEGAHLLSLIVMLWITWHATYGYVEADQKGRDNQRLAGQLAGHGAAPGGAPAGRVANGAPAGRVPNGNLAGHVPNGPLNGAPAGHFQVGLDPTGIYMLVPSHSEPRLPSVPFWEKDLDSWRSMARANHAITNASYQVGMFILTAAGLGGRAETG